MPVISVCYHHFLAFARFVIVALVLLCSTGQISAQSNADVVQFVFTVADQPVVLGRQYAIQGQPDSVQFDLARMYVSHVQLLAGQAVVAQSTNTHTLIDVADPTSALVPLDTTPVTATSLSFMLGIDSATQVSGAFGGDLDPTNGMYWAWQSGYINAKVEGTSRACPARNNRFQFHLGGYQAPHISMQAVTLPVAAGRPIVIHVALDAFMQHVDLSESYEVMSPNQQAVTLSERLAGVISVAP